MWEFIGVIVIGVIAIVFLLHTSSKHGREHFVPLNEDEELVEVNYRDVGVYAVYPNVYFE